MRLSLLFSFLFLAFSSLAQMAPEKLVAIKDASRWTKAGQSIRKAMAKDTLNPEPAYLMALYFFQAGHSTFHIDTASRYQRRAARMFFQGHRDVKVPDSIALRKLRTSIDSAAFARARRTGTEEAYQSFLTRFPGAAQTSQAIEARNEQAYLKAAKINTAKSYKGYLDRFPKSHRSAEARNRMEQLEFDETTKDKRLASYRKFYKEHPDNPNRPVAEKRIFELMTAPGTPAALLRFVNAYPDSRWSARARVLLFSLQREGESVPDGKWKTDSLRKEKEPDGYWVPVFKSGKYGFINEQGKEVVPPRFEEIPEGYRCGEITDRFVVTSRGLLARNGQMVWKGKVKDFDDLGLGFLFVATDSGGVVFHESGFRLHSRPVDDAMVIANRFIGVNINDAWSLASLAGSPLLTNTFDDIEVLDSVIQLTRNKKRILTTPSRISAVTEGTTFNDDFVFDEVKKWGDQHYWVRNGMLEGVIDANLKFIIPLDRQNLRKTSFGFVTTKGGNLGIKGIKTLEGKSYKQVMEQGNWVRLKDLVGTHWLFERKQGTLTEGDSVWFKGKQAFLRTGDSILVILQNGKRITLATDAPYKIKESADSSAYLVVQDKKGRTVFDAASGVRLFTSEFDDLEPVSTNLFMVTRVGKKGLVKKDGKVILPAEYDAIVSTGGYSFSLLKDKKFGWFDAQSGLLVRPVYDRNVKAYSPKLWLAYKDNGYSFLQGDGKPVPGQTWDEVEHWTDSVAWVKKGGSWKLLEVAAQKIKLDNIRQFKYIRDTGEKLAVVQQENVIGVVSNRKGVIVPLQYTDVVNLGTREAPLYFTERHITEAGITVVVYFNQYGKTVRSQAMEPDELDKITCDN